jgi:hypothetical protein
MVDRLLTERVLAKLPQFKDAAQASAIAKTKRWIGRSSNLDKLSETVEGLHADSLNFLPWSEWATCEGWFAHSARFNGLFDPTFVTYIAKMLKLTHKEVMELHCQSLDPRRLKYLISQRNGQRYQDFQLMSKAYVASAILRGKYHDELSKLTGLQISHHPIREMICRGGTASPIGLPVSNTISALAALVIHGAARQRRRKDRALCWADNVKRVKCLVASGREDIGARPTDNAAIDVALRIAREAAIQMGDRRFSLWLELGMSLGVGALTHILLSPWLALPVASSAEVALHKAEAGQKILNAFHFQGRKLKDLAAGRIASGWNAPVG